MRIEVDCHEIVEADIRAISLVKRGANRAPFKIVKGETEEQEPVRQEPEDLSWLTGGKRHGLDAVLHSARANKYGGGW